MFYSGRMVLTDNERDYLASQPLGRLATVSEVGLPQNNPVGFVFNEIAGTIDIGGRVMGTTRKFANVAATRVAALVVDDLVRRDPWTVRGIEIRGRAEAITGLDPNSPFVGGEIIRIFPTRIISWGLDPNHPDMYGRTISVSEAA
jgi:pyridoxamine 5'-phosphate oxidase family protein